MKALRFVVLLTSLGSTTGHAATYTVCGGGTCDFATIGAAVAGVSSGDTLDVKTGNYTEAVTVRKNLTIQGAGSGSSYWSNGGTPLYIDGNHTVSVSGFDSRDVWQHNGTGYVYLQWCDSDGVESNAVR